MPDLLTTYISNSPNNIIGGTVAEARNIISGNGDSQHPYSNGIGIYGTGTIGNLIQGNFIGTDVSGSADLGNTGEGISISEGATTNTIGGMTSGARNIISGNNQYGISITTWTSSPGQTSDNAILQNSPTLGGPKCRTRSIQLLLINNHYWVVLHGYRLTFLFEVTTIQATS